MKSKICFLVLLFAIVTSNLFSQNGFHSFGCNFTADTKVQSIYVTTYKTEAGDEDIFNHTLEVETNYVVNYNGVAVTVTYPNRDTVYNIVTDRTIKKTDSNGYIESFICDSGLVFDFIFSINKARVISVMVSGDGKSYIAYVQSK